MTTSGRPARLARADVVTVGVLYGVALVVHLLAVRAVSSSLVLTGEEMSVSIRDILFTVEERAQASVWSTNVIAPAYYWLASHLDPSYSLFSARRWKAIATALLAPLTYLAATRRLGCGRGAGAMAGLAVTLLPGVAMFGWMATENGLEAVSGTAGLLLSTSSRRAWTAAPLLAAIAVATYTAGLAWAVAVLVVCVVRAVGDGIRRQVEIGLAVVAGTVLVLAPLAWWTSGPQRVVVGGGRFDVAPRTNLATLLRQLTVDGRAYYFFDDRPALGSTALACVIAVALLIAAWTRWRALWPWLVVAAGTVALWSVSGNLPGPRRVVALSVVATLVLAVALDVLLRRTPERVRAAAAALATVAVLAPLAAGQLAWQQAYATGASRLTADFPIPPGPMPPTFAAWDAGLRAGAITPETMVREHDGLRTLAVVWLLADRQGRGTGQLPSPDRIVELTVPGATHR